MKKIIKLFWVVCVFILFSSICVYAAPNEFNGFLYSIKDYKNADGIVERGVCIYQCVSSDSNATMVFPNEIEGYSVVELSIKYPAFFANSDTRENLSKVVIPESVKIIDGTFRYCGNLTEVEFLGNNLKTIGNESFLGCKKLSEIKLPNSVEKILPSAFNGCESIQTFIIPESVVEIGKNPNGEYSSIISGAALMEVINLSQYDFPLDIAFRREGFWYYDTEGDERADKIPAGQTVYRIKIPISAQNYLNLVEPKLNKLQSTGISMSIVNDEEAFRKYIKSILKEYECNDFTAIINSTPHDTSKPHSFRPAVRGNRTNPDGNHGIGYAFIKIIAHDNPKEIYYKKSYPIKINPIPYKDCSDYSDDDNYWYEEDKTVNDEEYPAGIVLKNSPIYEGSWKNKNGLWRLITDKQTFATSQWARLNEKWYLFGDNSYMLSGWQLVDGKWYYMEPTGEMVTGWHFINGKWYYLDDSGAMLANTITPDGYRVNENGEWME